MTATIEPRTESRDAVESRPAQRPTQAPARVQAFSPCLIPLLCAQPSLLPRPAPSGLAPA